MKAKKMPRETHPAVLRQAVLRKLPPRIDTKGEIALPCVPALADQYAEKLLGIFALLGRKFNEPEAHKLREILDRWLEHGWAQSPHTRLVVRYKTEPPPISTISYNVSVEVVTVADEYERWTGPRTTALFGAFPDAKVMALARAQGEPPSTPILDIGAGTGRNALPLAQAGFPTDAVEIAPALANILRDEARLAGTGVRVFEGDATDGTLDLPKNHYGLVVIAEVVSSHIYDLDHLRRLFEVVAAALRPGGCVLFNAFLAMEGYRPDALARQLGLVALCSIFDRQDLDKTMAALGLHKVDEVSTLRYEKEHLPAEAWPPTEWFEDWSSGRNVFDLPRGRAPIDLRWLTYRRQGEPKNHVEPGTRTGPPVGDG
ncbi:MAG: class I SAM-dependent methyltransferase [Deltaproteobacteria bacterium]|nr:class I SAM-dependent methyltransferase [Deltaproteobacteria bacterium]